ncbi:MAG: carbamoyl-phosphate synthase (glutamine-hydrolyzing) large subunit [bacterium]|nr:carbamoyl-phosphate synthase (glutamine-hydrolyzing) large subunit [bacterium]
MKSQDFSSSIKTVLLLGSGALKIGEAGEFDYSGTQAIKALKEEGIRVILINPNIATVQTSEGLADDVYFLPVTPDFVTRVIEKEKPDGILLTFGGQTALNCGMELHRRNVFQKNNVAVLGTSIDAILSTEDRKKFSDRLSQMGLSTAQGKTITRKEEGLRFGRALGFPVMVRAGFSLGGAGSGIAKDAQALAEILSHALAATRQVIIEESLYGWKEIEYEVMRDRDDNCIAVCNMENFDPVGIHTGESIVVAPSQTLNDREYFSLRQVALDVIRDLKIVGECNIQFALHPKTHEYRIIEVNARLSRSSALASKATGYPLAYISAKLSLGKTLPELKNLITGKTSAFFEPALDYVVVKIPRWDLDKFVSVDAKIGSEMKSVGEVMSIARTFEEAIQKAARMLNDGYHGVIDKRFSHETIKDVLMRVATPGTMRLFDICSAFRLGVPAKKLHDLTKIDLWFLRKLEHIVEVYQALNQNSLTKAQLDQAKRCGFSDTQIGDITGKDSMTIRALRKRHGILPCVKRIDTMAGEFPATTNYLYLTYSGEQNDHSVSGEKRVIVLGCGPYAIGTSVEFDWCAVQAIGALRKKGVKSIVINCNPETVSTDFDEADVLYFEELTLERVMDIYDIERAPFILSVGGQIPNNLGSFLSSQSIPILGTKARDIYRAEHRETFSKLLDLTRIKQPEWGKVRSEKAAFATARKIGFPILVRPSFVLSGKSMTVIDSIAGLSSYIKTSDLSSKDHPLVMTKFLERATECDFDGVASNGKILVSALSEHIEGGGVHSGDSTLMLPSVSLGVDIKRNLLATSKRIVRALSISGPFNIQYLIRDDDAYVIECNLRASRSFPFISKVLNHNFIETAVRVLLGEKHFDIHVKTPGFYAIKAPQFSFQKLKGADPVLSVEMSSTGEVSAFGRDIYESYLTAVLSTGVSYPTKKAAFLSLGGMTGKLGFLKGAHLLSRLGFMIYATAGTHLFLRENGIVSTQVSKIHEGNGQIASGLFQHGTVDFAVVIPEQYSDRGIEKFHKTVTDGYLMRRLAIDMGIPMFTNVQSASYYVEALRRYRASEIQITSWREHIRGVV